MFWNVIRAVVIIGAGLCVYLVGASMIRKFKTNPADEAPGETEPVELRYRCGVCGAEVTMTASPVDEEPRPPRHCREEMILV